MDPAIIIAIITAFQVITVAVIGGIFNYITKKAEKKVEVQRQNDLAYRAEREKKDQLLEERDEAVYNLLLSVANGTEVILHKVHGDKLNGEVEDAIKSISRDKSEYNKIANKNMAHI